MKALIKTVILTVALTPIYSIDSFAADAVLVKGNASKVMIKYKNNGKKAKQHIKIHVK